MTLKFICDVWVVWSLSVVYLWWSFAALVHRSVMWCQLSPQTPGGSGGRGSVSTCPTQCGTTGGGRGTARSHSPTSANAVNVLEKEGAGKEREQKKTERKEDFSVRHNYDLKQTGRVRGRDINWQASRCGSTETEMPRVTLEEEAAADTSSTLPAGRMWCAGITLHKRTQNIDITASFPEPEQLAPRCELQRPRPKCQENKPEGNSHGCRTRLQLGASAWYFINHIKY